MARRSRPAGRLPGDETARPGGRNATHHPWAMEEGEVAESKRRGEDAVDEHLDEAFVDAVDDDTPDDLAADDDALLSSPARRSGGTATKEAPRKAAGKKAVAKESSTSSVGLFARIARFIHEVVAELRKVNWPSRPELITYTTVVVVFVVVMMLIVAGLDWVFAWLVTHVFG